MQYSISKLNSTKPYLIAQKSQDYNMDAGSFSLNSVEVIFNLELNSKLLLL